MATNLDRIDQRILSLLESNGRMSNMELAEKVGLSATPCARRVKLLEDRGILKGYTVIVDTSKLGMSLIVMVAVHLDSHGATVLDAFERRIIELPEVLEAYQITGSHEYMLKVIAKDLHAYSAFQRQKLLTIPHVLTVDSIFILKEVKHRNWTAL